MSRPSILVEDLCVRFRPYVEQKPTLRKSLRRRRLQEDVVALEDVSFTVGAGEALGVVGGNGAGKSTLLQCIAGTLRPNSGRVVVSGTASTLLQLGVGFIPELSGRRNVYLGGLAAGLRKLEIDDRFDEIVEYAELQDAIDRPLKTYSSGMFSRLAFSVALHQDPDVLLLDEVLSVGDEAFRQRSLQSMKDLLAQSKTIVLVSHNLSSVQRFCDSALWLNKGRVEAIGPTSSVLREYRQATRKSPKNEKRTDRPRASKPEWPISRKTEVVLRILAGEDIDRLSKELNVSSSKLGRWRQDFISAGRHGLRVVPKSDEPG